MHYAFLERVSDTEAESPIAGTEHKPAVVLNKPPAAFGKRRVVKLKSKVGAEDKEIEIEP